MNLTKDYERFRNNFKIIRGLLPDSCDTLLQQYRRPTIDFDKDFCNRNVVGLLNRKVRILQICMKLYASYR